MVPEIEGPVYLWKDIQICVISMALPMADIGKNVFILLYMMKGYLRAMNNSNLTSRIVIKVFLVLLKRVFFL
jgi:hypothetical protein